MSIQLNYRFVKHNKINKQNGESSEIFNSLSSQSHLFFRSLALVILLYHVISRILAKLFRFARDLYYTFRTSNFTSPSQASSRSALILEWWMRKLFFPAFRYWRLFLLSILCHFEWWGIWISRHTEKVWFMVWNSNRDKRTSQNE